MFLTIFCNFSYLVTILFFSFLSVLSTGLNFLVLWMGMEFMTFGTIVLFFSFGKNFFWNHKIMKYFIIQSFTALSLMIFFGMAIPEDSGSFLRNGAEFRLFLFFGVSSLWIKMGIFPFHSWIVEILKDSSPVIFWFVNIWNKIVPFFILISYGVNNLLPSEVIKLVVIMNLILVSLTIFQRSSNIMIFFFSGLMHSGNILLIIMECGTQRVLFYLILYYFLMSQVLMETSVGSMLNNKMEKITKEERANFLFLFFSLRGFPPSFFFFLKVFFFFSLLTSSRRFFSLFYLLILRSIYMFFIINLFSKKIFFKENLFSFNLKKSILLPSFSFSTSQSVIFLFILSII